MHTSHLLDRVIADTTLCQLLCFFADVEKLKQGYTYRAGLVDITNLLSLDAGNYMGTEPIGYAGYVEWFGRRIRFRTQTAK